MVLVGAVLELGRAGRPAAASRVAAAGYAATRRRSPAAARRLNAAMHALARMPEHSTRDEVPSMPDTILDVRNERPARRHELIFESFDRLAAGDGFELINDHDPKPLYYPLEAEQTGRFSWEYLERGPETWGVRIGRTA